MIQTSPVAASKGANVQEQLSLTDNRFLQAAVGWLELGNWQESNEELERITARMRAHPPEGAGGTRPRTAVGGNRGDLSNEISLDRDSQVCLHQAMLREELPKVTRARRRAWTA